MERQGSLEERTRGKKEVRETTGETERAIGEVTGEKERIEGVYEVGAAARGGEGEKKGGGTAVDDTGG